MTPEGQGTVVGSVLTAAALQWPHQAFKEHTRRSAQEEQGLPARISHMLRISQHPRNGTQAPSPATALIPAQI